MCQAAMAGLVNEKLHAWVSELRRGQRERWAIRIGVGACVCLWVCLRVRRVDGVVGGVGGGGQGGEFV